MLNCVIHTMGYTRSQQEKRPEEERAVASGKKILRRYTHSNVTSVTTLPTKAVIADDKSTKIHVQDIHSTQSKTAGKKRGNETKNNVIIFNGREDSHTRVMDAR